MNFAENMYECASHGLSRTHYWGFLSQNGTLSRGTASCTQTPARCSDFQMLAGMLLYFGKRKQVIYNLNLSCFHILHNMLFFRPNFIQWTLIITNSLGPVTLLCYIRVAKTKKYKEILNFGTKKLTLLYRDFVISVLYNKSPLYINTHPAKRYVRQYIMIFIDNLTSVGMTDAFCSFTRNVIFVTCLLCHSAHKWPKFYGLIVTEEHSHALPKLIFHYKWILWDWAEKVELA